MAKATLTFTDNEVKGTIDVVLVFDPEITAESKGGGAQAMATRCIHLLQTEMQNRVVDVEAE